MPRWGVDLGGTKIEGVILDDAGAVLARRRIPTEATNGYEHILGQIDTLIQTLERETGLRRAERIGFGTPGSTDPESGRIKNSNTQCLNGRLLGGDLSKRLGVETVLANDANCFALAEATLGAGRGHDVVFGVIMGTGTGGGVVVNGRVLQGRHGIAGEWGHNVLDPDGEPCYCGKRGCVETVISGPAVERGHARRTGQSLKMKDIAASSEPECRATIVKLAEDFARAIAVVVNIVDPDAVVIGGGVGNIDAIYELAPAAAPRYVFNPEFRTPFLKPLLGDSAGVFGAAMLV